MPGITRLELEVAVFTSRHESLAMPPPKWSRAHGWTGPAKPTGIPNKVSPPLPTSCPPEAPALGHVTIGKNPETQLIGITTIVAQTKLI